MTTFEKAIADYILHKGWLAKAKEDVETSKAIFNAAPRNPAREAILGPARPEGDYLAALSHFHNMEIGTGYTKTKAAIAKVAETNPTCLLWYPSDVSHYSSKDYAKYAKEYELKYTKAKAEADHAETEAVRIENEAKNYAKRTASDKALADTYAKADADAEAAANAVDDAALDDAATVASSKAAKAKANASATAGFAVKVAAAAVKAKATAVKAKATAVKAKADADYYARRVVELDEVLEAIKVAEANITAEY